VRTFAASVLIVVGLLSLTGEPTRSEPVGAQAAPVLAGRLAVVLGGGGLTGQSWEIGLLKGLRDDGLDLAQAELVIGTSAGSVAAAQLRSDQSLDTFYDALLAPPTITSPLDPAHIDVPYYQETGRMWQGVASTPALRIEVGARALAAARAFSEEEFVQRTVARLGVPGWPHQPLQISAVDVIDGTRRLIDRTQGVPIESAVAASTALPGVSAPITLGDRRYMDGGVAGTNVDAATGYGVIVMILPAGAVPDTEMERLRAQGSQVMIMRPDAESAAARGQDSQDPTRMRGSAEAGLRQAAAVAADLHNLLHGTSSSR
jgi:NTE family protein